MEIRKAGKLVKRIKGLAHNQFSGTADIMETMQESLQGIRTVKAFTLEQAVRMLSLVPATLWGFHDRGLISEGMTATSASRAAR